MVLGLFALLSRAKSDRAVYLMIVINQAASNLKCVKNKIKAVQLPLMATISKPRYVAIDEEVVPMR